jgi:hypothetical protein
MQSRAISATARRFTCSGKLFGALAPAFGMCSQSLHDAPLLGLCPGVRCISMNEVFDRFLIELGSRAG